LKNNKIEDKTNLKKVYREKTININQSLIIQATLKAQRKTKPWILDSGYSKHMTNDKQNLEDL